MRITIWITSWACAVTQRSYLPLPCFVQCTLLSLNTNAISSKRSCFNWNDIPLIATDSKNWCEALITSTQDFLISTPGWRIGDVDELTGMQTTSYRILQLDNHLCHFGSPHSTHTPLSLRMWSIYASSLSSNWCFLGVPNLNRALNHSCRQPSSISLEIEAYHKIA